MRHRPGTHDREGDPAGDGGAGADEPSLAFLVADPRNGAHLAVLYPLDKLKNADRKRRVLAEIASPPAPSPKPAGIAPLLRELMADYAATGLPPAYLPKNTASISDEEESE